MRSLAKFWDSMVVFLFVTMVFVVPLSTHKEPVPKPAPYGSVFYGMPDSVLIGIRRYPIAYPRSIISRDDGKPLMGVTYLWDGRIEVATRYRPDEVESTLIHEILHAMSHEYSLNLSESEVLALENAIYRTMKNNQWEIHIK